MVDHRNPCLIENTTWATNMAKLPADSTAPSTISSLHDRFAVHPEQTDQALPARIDDIPDNAATGFYSKK
jgi:hypothetical protein